MKRRDTNRRTMFAIAALLCAACASEPPTGPGAAPKSPASASPAAPPAAPAPVPVPAPAPLVEPTRDAKEKAQRAAAEAVEQLQNGDETTARATLERALSLDPGNDRAKMLLDQIRADAQRELGTTFFSYTVQPDDSLSKLAQRFLGDRFRFYILAKYNDIKNPSRLNTGQVIKIPGKEPPPAPPRPPEAAKPARLPEVAKPTEPVEPKPPEEPKMSDAEGLCRQGMALKDPDAAYKLFVEANRLDPNNPTCTKQLELTRGELVKKHDFNAERYAFRQQLDDAIREWDRVLEIDPNNQKAKKRRGDMDVQKIQLKKRAEMEAQKDQLKKRDTK